MALTDIFVSYSRKDSVFVGQLTEGLRRAQLDVWIDWEDIPYSSNWWAEISQGIIGASAFVCILSNDYFSSETCLAELKLAEESNKRVIPVSFKDFDRRLNTSNAVAKSNWLPFTTGDGFETSLRTLLDTLNADLEWRQFHSRLQMRATEWSLKRNDSSYALVGQDLDDAIKTVGAHKAPSPALTTLQLNYIEASKAGAKEQLRRQLRGFYLAALAYSIAQLFVIYLWGADELSESSMVKMSWVWLPGLCFAVAGLTVARHSMKAALALMGVAMAAFAFFYAAIWPSL